VQQSWGTIKRTNVAKWQDVILQGKKGHTRQLWDEPHTLHIVLQKLHAKERFKRCHVNHRATFCENSADRPCAAVPACTATARRQQAIDDRQGLIPRADITTKEYRRRSDIKFGIEPKSNHRFHAVIPPTPATHHRERTP
jgi:hypothetical protein